MKQDDSVKLLVVDDIQSNLDAMEALLTQPGVRVLKARSGEEALELLLQHEVALALLDVNMPVMDGFTLAELMRGNSRTRQIPLIFITAALHEPQKTFIGYQAGAVDFLHKPFAPEILVGKVRIFVELHQQKKMLAAKIAELEEALNINQMFVAVLGHDLRTPLAATMTGAELISALSADAKITSTARRIQACCMRMESMVRQLLDMALIRSGKIDLSPSIGDYQALAQSIIDEFLGRETPGSILLSCRGDTTAIFDRDRMAQVFANLIGNAVEHGEAGEQVMVAIDGTEADSISLSVANAGVIPESRLAVIFEPFQSGRQDRSASTGLGLGLYVVKSFVDAHGGNVSVRSVPGKGTIFTAMLPRSPVRTS